MQKGVSWLGKKQVSHADGKHPQDFCQEFAGQSSSWSLGLQACDTQLQHETLIILALQMYPIDVMHHKRDASTHWVGCRILMHAMPATAWATQKHLSVQT